MVAPRPKSLSSIIIHQAKNFTAEKQPRRYLLINCAVTFCWLKSVQCTCDTWTPQNAYRIPKHLPPLPFNHIHIPIPTKYQKQFRYRKVCELSATISPLINQYFCRLFFVDLWRENVEKRCRPASVKKSISSGWRSCWITTGRSWW